MKTFTEIEYLLRDLKDVEKCQNIMLDGGVVGRTEAGTRFFMGKMQQSNDIIRKICNYPPQWVRAVETIIALRNDH